ncbi:TPA: hypothetical protein DDZ86_00880 [Candidatus Dependentiae bacterium]|nr:MAG: hypothetical protein UW09_C0004G0058 [candidate division TM6 bacterium GW2011_GWF2_43_87]HBL98179.1 hypothetical protein [Candidatus Dependentiae bacterium]
MKNITCAKKFFAFIVVALCSQQLVATVLIDLIEKKDVQGVKSLLEPNFVVSWFYKSPDVNEKDSEGSTALHWACKKGLMDTIKLLLEKGANIKAVDKSGKKPFDLLGSKGTAQQRTELCMLLLKSGKKVVEIWSIFEHGIDPKMYDADGNTFLHLACQAGDFKIVTLLIAQGSDVSVKNKKQQTSVDLLGVQGSAKERAELCLSLFARNCKDFKPQIEQIIKGGVDVKVKDSQKRSVLHWVCKYGYLDAIKMCMDHEADIHAKDSAGDTPFDFLEKNQRTELCIWLLKTGKKSDEIYTLLKYDIDVKMYDADENTLLHFACQRGNFELVNFLIEKGADVSAKNKNKQTPVELLGAQGSSTERTELCLSILARNCKDFKPQVEQLIKGGVDVNAKDAQGRSLLHWVCKSGYLDAIKVCLDVKADVDSTDFDNYTPLHLACAQENLKVVKILVEKGIAINAKTLLNGHTPLHDACHHGFADIVEFLLVNGASVNIQDKHDETPLHWACQSGCLNVVKVLIEKGARFDIKGKDGKLPFDLLEQKQRTELCGLLIKHGKQKAVDSVQDLIKRGVDLTKQDGEGCTLLHFVNSCFIDSANLLIEQGANIEAKDGQGESPLFAACKNGCFDAVKFFITKGADVNTKNKAGDTPLLWAYKNGGFGLGTLLIENGASIAAIDKDGKGPIEVLATQDCAPQYRPGLLMLLIKKGCRDTSRLKALLSHNDFDINAPDINGNTALHYACEAGYFDVIKFLVKEGANFDVKNDDEKSPIDLLGVKGTLCQRTELFFLLCARENGCALMKLVDGGIDVGVCDGDGKTVLHHACQDSFLTFLWFEIGLLKKFIEQGADIEAKDGQGESPLFAACKNGCFDAVKFFITKGADVNTKNKAGDTPLMLACKKGQLQVARYLIEHGAKACMEDKDGHSPIDLLGEQGTPRERAKICLSLCALGGDGIENEIKRMIQVKKLVKDGVDLEVTGFEGGTLLHYASGNGYLDLVKLLVEKGVNVNQKDKHNATPLCWACASGYFGIVKFLVEKGADVNAKALGGETPLSLVWDSKSIKIEDRIKIALFLFENGAAGSTQDSGSKPIIETLCLYLNKEQCTKLFVSLVKRTNEDTFSQIKFLAFNGKLGTNFKDEHDKTLLHLVCQRGWFDPARILINKGCDVNAKDLCGNTPLYGACCGGYAEIAKLLIEKGAEVYVKNLEGTIPLDILRGKITPKERAELCLVLFKKNGVLHKSLIKRIIQDGADINVKDDNDGSTLLHWACSQGCLSLANFLLEKGANIEANDIDLDTPLMLARKKKNFELVRFLLEKGACGNAQNIYRESPFTYSDGESSHYYRVYSDSAADGGYTLFHQACEMGDYNLVKLLIERGVNVNIKNFTGWTPLHVAAKKGCFGIVKLLLERGANVNIESFTNWTPLHVAAKNGCFDTVKLLLEKGANISAKNNWGHTPLELVNIQKQGDIADLLIDKAADNTPLNHALFTGCFEEAKLLISKGAELANCSGLRAEAFSSSERVELCAWAIKYGYKDSAKLVKMLLAKSEAINTCDSRRRTVLHWASCCNLPDIVKFLIDKGAEVNTYDGADHTPLHDACYNGHVEVVKLLANSGSAKFDLGTAWGALPLHLACHNGNPEIVKLLVNKGSLVGARDNDLYTPLHCACRWHNLQAALFLIEVWPYYGLYDKNNVGMMPFDYLSSEERSWLLISLLMHKNKNSKVQEDLVKMGIDSKAVDKDGNSLLHWACRNGSADLVKLLITNGVLVDVKGWHNSTPLHWACFHGSLENVKVLVEQGATVNTMTEDGQTPLHWACHRDCNDIVKLLLAKGADINIKDADDKIPFDYFTLERRTQLLTSMMSAQDKDFNIQENLVESGVDTKTKVLNGSTLLHHASGIGSLKLAKLLIAKGADVNASNRYNKTPLRVACSCGQGDMVKLLRKNGGLFMKNGF